MQYLLFSFAVVVSLLLIARFIFIIRGNAGFRSACSESAGWLLLSSIVLGPAFAVVNSGSIGNAGERQPSSKTVAQKAVVAADVKPTQAAAAKQASEQIEKPRDQMTRRQLLAELHAETIEKFVKAPGFGYARRIIIRNDEFETPEKSRIYLARGAGKPATQEIPLPDRSLWDKHKDELARLRELLRRSQRSNKAAASSPEKADEIEDEPQPVEVVKTEPQWDEWEVADWELVSLMKHDPPVAYASSDLQKMHRLRAFATRPLDKLEKGALAKLRKGESLVVENGVNAIRVMGAVHARAKCIKCHRDKKVGDLLGAFSYELHRLRPIALAAAKAE